MKKTIVIIVCIVIFLVSCAAFLQFMLGPTLKTVVLKILRGIDLPLEMGEVRISIATGSVEISDIVLHQPPGFHPGPMLKIRKLRVRTELLPLFKKRVIVRRIELLDPELIIIGRGKTSNVAVFLGRLTGGQPAGPGPIISISDIRLVNCAVSFQHETETPLKIVFDAVGRGALFASGRDFTVKATLKGADLSPLGIGMDKDGRVTCDFVWRMPAGTQPPAAIPKEK